MEKIIRTIMDKKDAMQYIKSNDKTTKTLYISLHDKLDYDNLKLDSLKIIADNYDKVKDSLKLIYLQIPYEKIPRKEFGKIYKFYNKIKETVKCEVVIKKQLVTDCFNERNADKYWDLETIIKANNEINNVCEFIKKNKFSPFEAYAFIHSYVSTVANYNMSDITALSWASTDQFFVGAYLKLPEIVCMGFSALEKEIIDNLDMPGLDCDLIAVSFYDKQKKYQANHTRCFVKIKDDKYGINQTCFEDATWDNDKDCNYTKYAHFAMPNDCHENTLNEKYDYYIPEVITLSNLKNTRTIEDFSFNKIFNKSVESVNQLQIEKVYFNVLQKTYKDKSFGEIYSILKNMASSSYKEQKIRGFKGNLKREALMLDKKMAKEIFDKNLSHQKSWQKTL